MCEGERIRGTRTTQHDESKERARQQRTATERREHREYTHRHTDAHTTETPRHRDEKTFCTTRARGRMTATPCLWGRDEAGKQAGREGNPRAGEFTARTGIASARPPQTAGDYAGWATRTGWSWYARGTSSGGKYASTKSTHTRASATADHTHGHTTAMGD
ncbi:hypothetical protein GY45DRAFT_506707 [Cubamyces sp. BRFM 1775]|nr:hypothetical protein GY45DRAFT_506707 [Cubamyces sp. BRFM 1775]